MKINNSKYNLVNNFKGHEARKLDAIVVQSVKDTSGELFRQLDLIASQYKVPVIRANNRYTWMQDDFVITPDKKYFGCASKTMQKVINQYGLEELELPDLSKTFIVEPAGGNMIFATNNVGQKVILSAKSPYLGTLLGSEKEFGVDKIIELPIADYHADLFVTAIGDNKILVADDELTLKNIEEMICKIYEYIDKNPNDALIENILNVKQNIEILYERFKYFSQNSPFKNADKKTADVLSQEGFEVISVPSRVYEFACKPYSNVIKLANRKMNYSNALVFKNDLNETVFITGKSMLDKELGITKEISDKIDIGFEKAFIKALKPYIDEKNIHFIVGDDEFPIHRTLYELEGGLHCMCCEIPKANS